jgi:hypothetical protein
VRRSQGGGARGGAEGLAAAELGEEA